MRSFFSQEELLFRIQIVRAASVGQYANGVFNSVRTLAVSRERSEEKQKQNKSAMQGREYAPYHYEYGTFYDRSRRFAFICPYFIGGLLFNTLHSGKVSPIEVLTNVTPALS